MKHTQTFYLLSQVTPSEYCDLSSLLSLHPFFLCCQHRHYLTLTTRPKDSRKYWRDSGLPTLPRPVQRGSTSFSFSHSPSKAGYSRPDRWMLSRGHGDKAKVICMGIHPMLISSSHTTVASPMTSPRGDFNSIWRRDLCWACFSHLSSVYLLISEHWIVVTFHWAKRDTNAQKIKRSKEKHDCQQVSSYITLLCRLCLALVVELPHSSLHRCYFFFSSLSLPSSYLRRCIFTFLNGVRSCFR